jgi:glucosamine-phosphate N-acetyltransferase
MSAIAASSDDVSIFPLSLLSSLPLPIPQGYTLRPLQRQDWSRGYFECLSTLTWVGDGTRNPSGDVQSADNTYSGIVKDGERFREKFEKQFDWMREKGEGWWYNVVVEWEGRVVGTGVVVVERKL